MGYLFTYLPCHLFTIRDVSIYLGDFPSEDFSTLAYTQDVGGPNEPQCIIGIFEATIIYGKGLINLLF